jgi:hypothetical protein
MFKKNIDGILRISGLSLILFLLYAIGLPADSKIRLIITLIAMFTSLILAVLTAIITTGLLMQEINDHIACLEFFLFFWSISLLANILRKPQPAFNFYNPDSLLVLPLLALAYSIVRAWLKKRRMANEKSIGNQVS